MDIDNNAIELARRFIEKRISSPYNLLVKDPNTGNYYQVSIEKYQPSESEKLFESVLHPAASNVCKYCGK